MTAEFTHSQTTDSPSSTARYEVVTRTIVTTVCSRTAVASRGRMKR
jgi:hypothetical protein